MNYMANGSGDYWDYLEHAGKKGMKWGYTNGSRNGNRVAESGTYTDENGNTRTYSTVGDYANTTKNRRIAATTKSAADRAIGNEKAARRARIAADKAKGNARVARRAQIARDKSIGNRVAAQKAANRTKTRISDISTHTTGGKTRFATLYLTDGNGDSKGQKIISGDEYNKHYRKYDRNLKLAKLGALKRADPKKSGVSYTAKKVARGAKHKTRVASSRASNIYGKASSAVSGAVTSAKKTAKRAARYAKHKSRVASSRASNLYNKVTSSSAAKKLKKTSRSAKHKSRVASSRAKNMVSNLLNR